MRESMLGAALLFFGIAAANATPAINCDPRSDNFTLPDGYTAIEAVSRVPPVYPFAPLENHEGGFVVLEFDVSADGETTNIEIVEAEPYWGFRDASRTALRQWRYAPHTIDGVPTICEGVRFKFDFRVDPNSQ